MARRLGGPLAIVVGTLAVTAGAWAQPVVDDPVFGQRLQWGLERIGAPEAWARGTGRGVTIAVVDSGVDLAHEDLRDQVAGHVSCIGANGDPDRCFGDGQDDNGHGTHVAGIALATTDNGRGIAGVAPDARLLAVRVLENDCSATGCTASGTSADVSAGIRWAVEHGADVVNLSLGGGPAQGALGCSFCQAIEEAWAAGVVVVVAAGNDSALPSGFGGEHAVVVTATTRDDARASYSSSSAALLRSARWPIAAPGGEGETRAADCAPGGTPKGILSTYWTPDGTGSAYACQAGTSMAAPHVSGALAVLLGLGHTPESAIERLLATAEDLGPAGRDASFGYGLVDLAAAVGPPIASTPPPTTTPPTTATTAADAVGTASGAPTAGPTTTPAPPAHEAVQPPETSTAAPFDAGTGSHRQAPGWLVALALAAVCGSGAGTIATAHRLGRR